MNREEILSLLSEINQSFPKTLSANDFPQAKVDKQQLLNNLMELRERGLIDGKFIVSRQRETYNMPKDALGIIINKHGMEFMEEKQAPVTQTITNNISINSSDGANIPLNIAAGNISINNDIDPTKLLEVILQNIEKTNLEPDQKKSMVQSVKSMFASAAPPITAAILVESAKALMGP